MVLPDVNVLVHGHRSDSVHYAACRAWLESVIGSDEAFGVCELVLSGFVRVEWISRDRSILSPNGINRIAAC